MIDIIPTLEDNYTYVIRSADKAILIDCGEAAPIIEYLQKLSLRPTHLLCTHHHGDHIAGIPDLKKKYPELIVMGPEKDRSRIKEMETCLKDQQQITLNNIKFECIETPGHTLNHLCYYSEELKALFTGDTLFSLSCGRLFEGTPEQMFNSLQKIKSLPDDILIYCGHEYTKKNAEFTLSLEPDNENLIVRMKEIETLRAANKPTLPVLLGIEKETNLFLKANTVKKFALLREKRDHF